MQAVVAGLQLGVPTEHFRAGEACCSGTSQTPSAPPPFLLPGATSPRGAGAGGLCEAMSIEGVDIKFVGVVQSFNEAKKFGMVVCEEAHAMWGQEIYAYQDVLKSADAGIGDTIRFGIHISTRGQPQVSLPVFKIGPDGQPLNVPAGTSFVNAEDAIIEDPSLLERIKEEVENQSSRQNTKKRKVDGGGKGKDGKGKGGPPSMKGGGWPAAAPVGYGSPKGGGGGGRGDWSSKGQWSGGDSWGGGDRWGGGGGGGGGWNPQEVTLFVSGVPVGVQRRELLHIFRQYAGFSHMRQVDREDHCLVFVSFATQAQAQFVADALTGYVFDEEAPPDQRQILSLTPAKEKMRSDKGGGKGFGF